MLKFLQILFARHWQTCILVTMDHAQLVECVLLRPLQIFHRPSMLFFVKYQPVSGVDRTYLQVDPANRFNAFPDSVRQPADRSTAQVSFPTCPRLRVTHCEFARLGGFDSLAVIRRPQTARQPLEAR